MRAPRPDMLEIHCQADYLNCLVISLGSGIMFYLILEDIASIFKLLRRRK
jgi:hypothetical protein